MFAGPKPPHPRSQPNISFGCAGGGPSSRKQVRQKSLVLRRDIAARVLLTKTETGAADYRITAEIKSIRRQANAPVLTTQLAKRPFFQSLISFGGDYMELPKAFQGSSPKSAHANVAALAQEISTTLSETLQAASGKQ